MKLTLHRLRLPLQHTFTISRESINHQGSLIVELEHDGLQGLGEVTENAFYGHTLESLCGAISRVEPLLHQYDVAPPDTVWPRMLDALGGNTFALSAIDMAAHDLWAKRQGAATWQAWGLTWTNVPMSSYTIGIDTAEVMVAKLKEKPDWSLYKIKLGTADDLQLVAELRRHTDATFRVDANCAWTAEQTVAYSRTLKELGVEFIEQPLRREASDDDKRHVYLQSALPIVADEDCQTWSDVERCQGRYHGINVKICKCGGLTPALGMLRLARQLGMKTMVGCMVESSVGISGAAQLLPLLDYTDLDGAVLLEDEPATGVRIEQGVVVTRSLPGTGAALDKARLGSFRPLPPDPPSS